jgi:hypothetical protein
MPGTRRDARCATLLGLAQATADDPSLVSASLWMAHWLRHTRKASFERGETIKARAACVQGGDLTLNAGRRHVWVPY